ncbi:multifunctional CCA addition/repair protein [Legionella israelensis]|uniref:multifunctional CCA addition/repair protein n=1 Tax=Legionella israelensis TaxID=454 RepID=UPI00117C83F5|nr:multifunctional CCA addition/repair protein [Legionella israelensis]QDP71127.1 multifunctional CCA addition/repair protein [Legionella israelensis]
MKVYLVGGAVRDQLLGYPVKERDWVVVGATPEELKQKGFRQVGRDFPVFIHPETGEEYALARTERKSGSGYYGFQCHYSPDVTLEEDLQRRDLTINAMALDENNLLIDPYHGKRDLENKYLRHISPAFSEDPVRVLRTARFMARYHHLGFHLANETRSLMYRMVKTGELNHLVAERVWQEWQRSLDECNPEMFIHTLRECGALKIILPEIDRLFGVPNPSHHHPEVDTGVHSLLVLQAAVKLSKEPLVRFVALLHDLGKALTPMKEWPRHHGHEEKGVDVIEALCERLRIPADYRSLAVLTSRFHLNIHRLFELNASTIVKILEKTDAFRRIARFDQLLLACEADAQGRGREVDYKQASSWQYIRTECAKVTAKTLVEQGYQGKAIQEQLHQRRVACVDFIKKSWKKNEK